HAQYKLQYFLQIPFPPGAQPLERRAAPLPGGEEGEYMLALKQELRRAVRGLPYFVRPGAPRRVSPNPPKLSPNPPKLSPVTSEEEEEKEEEEEGKEEEEEEYDEEEHEEETDYVLSYFDNGESFGPDSDDNGDEAVY
ncbi:DNA-directed RNA polymerase III subunit RPC7-like, partial [Passer montanus]|uniref:DNA-directed RNA polymerase III subunit RPC7-like n=1 Tax=Passer montanus TaxID=9160 RepID=UPI001960C57C